MASHTNTWIYGGLDFETYCDLDLKKVGMSRYMAHPSFTVLCAGAVSGTIEQPLLRSEQLDFVQDTTAAYNLLPDFLAQVDYIGAHNAPFEEGCLKWLEKQTNNPAFWSQRSFDLIDTAVIARAMGAAGKLEAAAPQLLGGNKLEMGAGLIQKFSVPTKANGGKPYTPAELQVDLGLLQDWDDFLWYCREDAYLSLQFMLKYYGEFPNREWAFAEITNSMNNEGWYVDRDLVERMQAAYVANTEALVKNFHHRYGVPGKPELNMRSHPQLKAWCLERGVRAKSFDVLNLEKLRKQVTAKTRELTVLDSKFQNYMEVLDLIMVKQALGGSSLAKLQKILDLVDDDGRLRGQYLHVGAGQSWRTSGRGAQLQNLPRLNNIDDVYEDIMSWDNDKISENIRQIFEAEDPDGQLVVGDLSAIESRLLGYVAGEEWKLEAYRNGQEIYKLLAMKFPAYYGVSYDDVTPEMRKAGKVGELACGYGAGSGAVQRFAEKMGIILSDDEATEIQQGWRQANRNITSLWATLDEMLHTALSQKQATTYHFARAGWIKISPADTPQSLTALNPEGQSIEVIVMNGSSEYFRRYIHGAYLVGNDIQYYKPSELKSGDLWRKRMSEPPHAPYKMYGGKLTGIIIQSLAREIFFRGLQSLEYSLHRVPNTKMIGQFHDEVVVEWTPDDQGIPLDRLRSMMFTALTGSAWSRLPLDAHIDAHHRYIK